MDGVWHWEAPPAFFTDGRFLEEDEQGAITWIPWPIVAGSFGRRFKGGSYWLDWCGEGPPPWSESFLVDAVSRVRIEVEHVTHLYGHAFEPTSLTPAPPVVVPVKAKLPGSSYSIDEAAAFLGLSRTTFKKIVMPFIPSAPAGRRRTYDEKDLIQWRDMQKVGSSLNLTRPRPIASASRTVAPALTDPRVQATKARLLRLQRRSTPRS